MTKEEKQALPTILDILEELAKAEYQSYVEWNTQPNYLAEYFAEDGEYMYVARSSHSILRKLMPGSLSTFSLYRGQNQYFPNCRPSIYRIPEVYNREEWEVINRVRTAEFISILTKHPVVQDLQKNILVELVPLAQHYGFATEYMDITNNKWVAAFFAVTHYENDIYTPVDENFKDGVGIMYVSMPSKNKEIQKFWMSEKLQALGFQYFARPTKQYSLVFEMADGEDMNQNPAWRKILFRHDKAASEIVYKMSWKQERWFPNDVLSDKARKIRSIDYELAESSILHAKAKFNLPQSIENIIEILKRHDIRWHKGNTIAADFTDQERNDDWRNWIEFGKMDLMSRIKKPMRFYNFY